jgi:hypothetical protein
VIVFLVCRRWLIEKYPSERRKLKLKSKAKFRPQSGLTKQQLLSPQAPVKLAHLPVKLLLLPARPLHLLVKLPLPPVRLLQPQANLAAANQPAKVSLAAAVEDKLIE